MKKTRVRSLGSRSKEKVNDGLCQEVEESQVWCPGNQKALFKEIVSVKCSIIIKLIKDKKYLLSLVMRRSLIILTKASLAVGAKENCNVLIESTSLRWAVNIK